MIWSWRTRSYSQTGLGAEELLPAECALGLECVVFFYFFSLLSSFYLLFFLTFVSEQFSFSGHFVNCQLYYASCSVFCCSEVAGKYSFFLTQKQFFINRFMYFFTSFLPFTFLMYCPFQSRHPSIGNESQKEVNDVDVDVQS